MNIKNLNEFIANNTVALDKSIPPTIDYDDWSVTFHVSMLNEKTDIEQWFKDNEVFTVKHTDELAEALDDEDFRPFIAFHYGPDDLDIYRIFIKDITVHYGRIIIYKTGEAILVKKIRPTTDDCSKNTPSTSTEGDEWDRILKKLDILIEKLEDMKGDNKCDDEDEDYDGCDGCNGCDGCDGCCDDDECEVKDEDEDEDEVEETPKFDTYTCSIEGKLGPDGVFHVKETTNDGKVIEKSVQLDAKDGSDGILKKLSGLAEDIRKAGGGIDLNEMIP